MKMILMAFYSSGKDWGAPFLGIRTFIEEERLERTTDPTGRPVETARGWFVELPLDVSNPKDPQISDRDGGIVLSYGVGSIARPDGKNPDVKYDRVERGNNATVKPGGGRLVIESGPLVTHWMIRHVTGMQGAEKLSFRDAMVFDLAWPEIIRIVKSLLNRSVKSGTWRIRVGEVSVPA